MGPAKRLARPSAAGSSNAGAQPAKRAKQASRETLSKFFGLQPAKPAISSASTSPSADDAVSIASESFTAWTAPPTIIREPEDWLSEGDMKAMEDEDGAMKAKEDEDGAMKAMEDERWGHEAQQGQAKEDGTMKAMKALQTAIDAAFDAGAAMQAIENEKCAEFVSQQIGGEALTECNVQKLQALLKRQAEERLKQEALKPSGDVLSDADKKQAETLEKVIKDGQLDPRSYLGGMFRKAHPKGTPAGEEYAALTRQEAQMFRVEWAKKQYQHIKERRCLTKSWKRVDSTKGTYRNFGRLVQDFGGWGCAEALEGATSCLNKCTLMGPSWLMKHPQSGLIEYLVLEQEWTETYSECWEHFKEEWNDEAKKAKEDGAMKAKGALPKKGAKKPKEDGAKKALPGTKPKEDPPATPKPVDRGKKMLNELIKSSASLKAMFQGASTSLMQLMEKIDTEPEWDWAKGGSKQQRLKEQQQLVKDAFSEWHKEYLTTADFGTIRKKYSNDRVSVELATFLGTKPLIEKLQVLVTGMFKAHIELTKED